MPFQAAATHSYLAVVYLLRHLGLRKQSPQVYAPFGGTKFITWCLRCPIRGMTTRSRFFHLPQMSLDCATLKHGGMLFKSRLTEVMLLIKASSIYLKTDPVSYWWRRLAKYIRTSNSLHDCFCFSVDIVLILLGKERIHLFYLLLLLNRSAN